MRPIGQRVIIRKMPFMNPDPFAGRMGTIIDTEKYSRSEPPYYRVRLDVPVEIEGVGLVRDDLWMGQCLRTIR